MQVVVKRPHIRIDGEITDELVRYLKKVYGEIEVITDVEEEFVEITESDWYRRFETLESLISLSFELAAGINAASSLIGNTAETLPTDVSDEWEIVNVIANTLDVSDLGDLRAEGQLKEQLRSAIDSAQLVAFELAAPTPEEIADKRTLIYVSLHGLVHEGLTARHGVVFHASAAALRRFVEAGGTLVCNGASSARAIDRFALPVTDVVRGLEPGAFSIPGSIVRVDYDPAHPLAFGMPSRGVGFFGRSQAFSTSATTSGQPSPVVVASYPAEPLLLSGYAQGEAAIQGRAAVVEAPVGKGRIVLFGFNVVNRYQTPAVVKVLLNALYDRPAEPDAAPAGRQR